MSMNAIFAIKCIIVMIDGNINRLTVLEVT